MKLVSDSSAVRSRGTTKSQSVAGDFFRQAPPDVKSSQAEEWIEAFEKDFWPAYPHKVGKFMARKAWMRVKPWTQAQLDALFEGLERWKRYWENHQTEKRFMPYPATWLNQHRWEDTPE